MEGVIDTAKAFLSRNDLQYLFAIVAYWIMCIRGYFHIFWEEALPITILLNIIIIGALALYKIKKITILFSFLAILTLYNRDALALLDILAMAYILENISIKKLAIINIVSLITFLIIWSIGISTGRIFDEVELGPKGIAHYMGFNNPNGVGMQGFTLICSLYLLCRNNFLKFLLIILIPIINQIFYEYSLSRTPWIAGYILLLCIVVQLLGFFRSYTKYVIALLPIIIICVVGYIALNLSSLWELNMLTSGRVRYAATLLMRMTPINFIIGMPVPEDLIIDNSYLMILCDGGIISLFFFLIGFYRGVLNNWRWIHSYIPFIVATIAVGVTENSFASVSGLTVIFWHLIFFQKHSETVKLHLK